MQYIMSEKSKSINWTNNPDNCDTLIKLLEGCISENPECTDFPHSCKVYLNLLNTCTQKADSKPRYKTLENT